MLRHAGFSLLELLVVVVIIGLGTAIVGFAIGNNKPQELRNNARDFANFTAQVEDEAILGRESWGVQIYREAATDDDSERIAYRYMHLTDKGWLAEAPRDIPVSARFVENVAAILTVEGTEQAIEPIAKDKPATPTIWLAPGGEVTPFELQLRFVGESEGPIVRSDALGRIELDVEQNEKK
ncbi:MAG: hypothetical protein JWM78_3273 [Verrucomicrobiaceae bacterium]|nr:hypothetical protein [Verrucomicrobiaceae bacterium]